MARPSRYSPEVRERAIRMVREHGPEHRDLETLQRQAAGIHLIAAAGG